MAIKNCCLCFCLSVALINAAPAIAKKNTAITDNDLNGVRKKINSLQENIVQKEQEKKVTQKNIIEAEQSLKTTSSELENIELQIKHAKLKQANLNKKIIFTKNNIANTRKSIGNMLNQQYKRGQHDAVALLLSAGEPNQRGRDMVYYQYMAAAQNKLLQQLQTQQADLSSLSFELEQGLKNLNQLEQIKIAHKNQLEDIKSAQQAKSDSLSSNINHQKKTLLKLKDDEKRMSYLLEEIQRASQKELASIKKQSAKKISAKIQRPNQQNIAIDSSADDSNAGQEFSQIKGHLKLPIAGKITGRFGDKRAEGGSWKGIFISASAGQSVHVVADGKVAYADNLRGFGKTVVVNHGGNYMTIYTGLSKFACASGKIVHAGESLGNSGALDNGKAGLYFEIRYRGKTVNPLTWAK